MLRCPNCGAEYNDNTWFCVNCGTMLDAEKDKIVQEAAEPEPEEEQVVEAEAAETAEEVSEEPKETEAVETEESESAETEEAEADEPKIVTYSSYAGGSANVDYVSSADGESMEPVDEVESEGFAEYIDKEVEAEDKKEPQAEEENEPEGTEEEPETEETVEEAEAEEPVEEAESEELVEEAEEAEAEPEAEEEPEEVESEESAKEETEEETEEAEAEEPVEEVAVEEEPEPEEEQEPDEPEEEPETEEPVEEEPEEVVEEAEEAEESEPEPEEEPETEEPVEEEPVEPEAKEEEESEEPEPKESQPESAEDELLPEEEEINTFAGTTVIPTLLAKSDEAQEELHESDAADIVSVQDDDQTYDSDQAGRYSYDYDENVVRDSGSIGWGILGFFFPLIGLILFIAWHRSKPNSAKSAGLGALLSVIVHFVLSIIAFIVLGIGTAFMAAEEGVDMGAIAEQITAFVQSARL